MRKSETILTIDSGNSTAKASVLRGEDVLESIRIEENITIESLLPLLERWDIDGGIYCSVGHHDARLIESLRLLLNGQLLVLTHTTPLPIKVEYSTPATLGMDRVAAAAGAFTLLGDNPALIVDAGTAITLDLIAGGIFKGGNIAPGLSLRFKSLHEFTSALPLIDPRGETPVIGHDTASAIRSGVARGLAYEVTMLYDRLKNDYPQLAVVMTGGDASTLCGLIDNDIMNLRREPDLVALGLREIYKYNANEKI